MERTKDSIFEVFGISYQEGIDIVANLLSEFCYKNGVDESHMISFIYSKYPEEKLKNFAVYQCGKFIQQHETCVDLKHEEESTLVSSMATTNKYHLEEREEIAEVLYNKMLSQYENTLNGKDQPVDGD